MSQFGHFSELQGKGTVQEAHKTHPARVFGRIVRRDVSPAAASRGGPQAAAQRKRGPDTEPEDSHSL